MTTQAQSVRLAEESVKSLDELFKSIGSQKNQDTPLYQAFRLAKKIILSNPKNFPLIKVQLETLFVRITELIFQYLLKSQDIGITQLDGTLEIFNLRKTFVPSFDSEIHLSITEILRAQLTAIFAAVQTGETDLELLFGGDNFWGVLSPLPVTKAIKNWSTTIAGLMMSLGLEDVIFEDAWLYQAVAIIDKDTTQTCLLVHGQTQPPGTPFQLEGVPRYGDNILKPPFHDWCRTSRALIEDKDARSFLTAEMIDTAGDELIRRTT